MDRSYYQIIHEAHDISRMSVYIVQNADYKPEIKAVTDHLVIDIIKDMQRLNMTLQEVIKRQEIASGNSTS